MSHLHPTPPQRLSRSSQSDPCSAAEDAKLLPLFTALDALERRPDSPLLVALDGPCASGKTTLAARLQHIYDCNVFHMDDFFLPPERKTPQRLAQPGGNVDRERFEQEVLLPLSRGQTASFRRYDCHSGVLLPPVTPPAKRLNLVEGVYALHPALRSYYALRVFLSSEMPVRLERLSRRGGPELLARFRSVWIPLEDLYFRECAVAECCDVRLSL